MDDETISLIAADVGARLGIEGLHDWLAAVDRREDDLREKVAELERRLEDLSRFVYHPGEY